MRKRFVQTTIGLVRRSAVGAHRWVAFSARGQIGFVTYDALLQLAEAGSDAEAVFDAHAESILELFFRRLSTEPRRDPVGRLVLHDLDRSESLVAGR